ncbi:MAG: 5'-methylthioadenosine/S-adenosylhomocysteine nucleosidase [Acholeplasma sp.]|nr:5'-methylthioadenosine/S-adenosylhomocysteine nucleosidase [Acholeplasma sp.]
MILIIGAMASETSQIEQLIQNQNWLSIAGKPIVLGTINDQKVMLATTGVGKVNASMVLSAILSKYPIDWIINVGLVGGFMPLVQGEMVIVNQAIYHDFDLTIFGYEKGQVPQMPVYYQTDVKLLNKLSSLLNVKHVKLYTGDSFTTSLIEENACCDMEGAAFYQVAYLFEKPIISVKVISDVIGKPSQIEAYEAFEQSCSQRFKTLIGLVL